MSARQWKPGDVAVVTREDGATTVGLWTRYGYGWQCVEGGAPITDARPLVVIDPEDRGQVLDLVNKTWSALVRPDVAADRMQAALRSLVTPPRPEEPTGLGAVVEDEQGLRWVRCENADLEPHWYSRNKRRDKYSDLAAVKVLSEGIQP